MPKKDSEQLAHIINLPIIDGKKRGIEAKRAARKELQIMISFKSLINHSDWGQTEFCAMALGVGQARASNIFNISSPDRGNITLMQALLISHYLGYTLDVNKQLESKWDGSISTQEGGGSMMKIGGDVGMLRDALRSAEQDKITMRSMIDHLISTQKNLEKEVEKLKKSLAQLGGTGGGCAEAV